SLNRVEKSQLLDLLNRHLHHYSSVIDTQDTSLNNFAQSVEAVISSGVGAYSMWSQK
uniref:Uncharacterized protein n=1 Tax=Amphimedon queenslandica TaxID=400682 RepID=A0A1X7TIA8_AMPQE